MRKATSTYRALIGLTMIFVLIAAFSFAAFREEKESCAQAQNCARQEAPQKGGEMLWDGFSRRFVNVMTIK